MQGWESGRWPLAALRAMDLIRLRFWLLRGGAQPTLLDTLQDAIQADLVIAEVVEAGDQLVKAGWHPLGVAVHQRNLSDLITWPLTGTVPTPLRNLATVQVRRRGPVRTQPTLTEEEQRRFFDHLLVIADTYRHKIAPLAHRQAIYLLGFDTRPPRLSGYAPSNSTLCGMPTMTGHQASRPANRLYLRLTLAHEQRALIRAPALGTKFEWYRPARRPEHRQLRRAADHLNPS